MTPLTPEQLGVCSWSLQARGADDLVAKVKATGVKDVQLALSAHRDDPAALDGVRTSLDAIGGRIVSGMFGAVQEDYSSLDSIRRTGGFVPDDAWDENWHVAQAAAKAANLMEVDLVSTHAGFLPEDPKDPAYGKLLKRLQRIADLFADHGLTLLFETGQETAAHLNHFLDRFGRDNVGINFDPANMILYDKGDPIAALRELMPRVLQVHIKDALRTKSPGQWGSEVVVGTGEVDWPAFLQILAENNFMGNMVIEREAGDDRVGDIRAAAMKLRSLMAGR